MADYALFRPVLNKTEGLFSRNPNDTGGMTYRGISRNYHPNWPGWTIIDFQLATNSGISDKALGNKLKSLGYLEDLVNDLYRPMWNKIGANQLDQNLANLYMDWYIHKPADAVEAMQRILNTRYKAGLTVDGDPGSKTNGAILKADPNILYNELRKARIASYESQRFSSPTFWSSWVGRVKKHFPELNIDPWPIPTSVKVAGLGLGLGLLYYLSGERRREGSGRQTLPAPHLPN